MHCLRLNGSWRTAQDAALRPGPRLSRPALSPLSRGPGASARARLVLKLNPRRHLVLRALNPTTTTSYPARRLHLQDTSLHRPPSLLKLAPTSAVRYCSHRRNMCKQFGVEGHASAVDITQGREVLPTNVKPLHYDLTLEPNFSDFTYDGTVVIEWAISSLPIINSH